MAAGLIGALAVLYGAQYIPGAAKPAADGVAVAELRSEITALQTKIAEAAPEPGPGVDLAPLTQRVAEVEGLAASLSTLQAGQQALSGRAAELESRLTTLADTPAPAPSAELPPELIRRLAQLEESMQTVAAAATEEGAGPVPQIAALSGRINDFSSELGTKLEAFRAEIDTELAAAEARVAEQSEALGAADRAAMEAIETLKAGRKRLGLEIETAKSEASAMKSALERATTAAAANGQSIEALEASIKRIETAVTIFSKTMEDTMASFVTEQQVAAAVAPLTAKLGEMTASLGSVVERESSRQQSSRRIVMALELAELKRVLDRGEAMGPALEKVVAAAPDGVDLSSLKKYAGGAVRTASQLQQDFSSVAREALAADAAASGDGGVLDQLFSGARSMVQVRRKGDLPGDSAEAVVARTEVRLSAGNLSDALEEVRGLKGAAAEAAAEWLGQLEARVAVEAAMAAVDAQLKETLAGPATN